MPTKSIFKNIIIDDIERFDSALKKAEKKKETESTKELNHYGDITEMVKQKTGSENLALQVCIRKRIP